VAVQVHPQAPDLIEAIVDAAAAAIRNQAPTLTYKPEQVRGLTVELTVGRDGQVKDAITFVERRARADALLDHQSVRAG
jgi:hypothetical protein